MPVPADWRPLFPKSTYRTFLDIDPEKALLPLRGVPRPAGCPLSGSVLFVSDRNRYRLCSDRAAAREEPAARSRCLCSRCCAVSASPFSLSDGNQHIEFSPIALPCAQPAARSRCLCSRCEAVSASPFSLSDGNQHIEFSPTALPCAQPAARSRRICSRCSAVFCYLRFGARARSFTRHRPPVVSTRGARMLRHRLLGRPRHLEKNLKIFSSQRASPNSSEMRPSECMQENFSRSYRGKS